LAFTKGGGGYREYWLLALRGLKTSAVGGEDQSSSADGQPHMNAVVVDNAFHDFFGSLKPLYEMT
jgi:hypothetical protein